MVQSDEDCGQKVKRHVQAGWNEWRRGSSVLCDKRLSVRIKENGFQHSGETGHVV